MESAKKLILYRDFKQGRVFEDFAWIMEQCGELCRKGTQEPQCGNPHGEGCPAENISGSREELQSRCYSCLHSLIELSASHGFEGNLWQSYLAFLLVNHENAYSIACEMKGEVTGSIHELALHDFRILKGFFDFDLQVLADCLKMPELAILKDYQGPGQGGRIFSQRIQDQICALGVRLAQAGTAERFQGEVTEFYRNFGVGSLGLHKAFRVEHTEDGAGIVPVANIAHIHLDDLIGYEAAKQKLIDNTEAFVNGKQANNCLLFGDAGTGKSTSIKAIINQYYKQGLRMIEIYKHQFQDLNGVIGKIKNRNYKFIIYMDDLSFEEFEIEYKYLKAVIEGGLEKKPENVLIYATSNRRHLVREKFSDKAERDDELHTNDTVQEKLSLVSRFGVTIYFGKPEKKEFQNIVKALAGRHQVAMEEQELLAEANKWELSHGGFLEGLPSSLLTTCWGNNEPSRCKRRGIHSNRKEQK